MTVRHFYPKGCWTVKKKWAKIPGWGCVLQSLNLKKYFQTMSFRREPQDDRIIIFGRYPRPGKVKTRLIPALGPAGAADLQRRLTEKTLETVIEAASDRGIDVEFRFEGGRDVIADCKLQISELQLANPDRRLAINESPLLTCFLKEEVVLT